MTSVTDEERFVRLEIKAAYLEKTALDLEEVVLKQGKLIDDLTGRLQRLERQGQASEDPGELPHEKPPHY